MRNEAHEKNEKVDAGRLLSTQGSVEVIPVTQGVLTQLHDAQVAKRYDSKGTEKQLLARLPSYFDVDQRMSQKLTVLKDDTCEVKENSVTQRFPGHNTEASSSRQGRSGT